MSRKHHELVVWQESIDLVRMIYELTKTFPKEEVYGLTNQIRRSAVSVPSNIAEGAARGTNKEFIQFLIVARGSLSELETQLIIAKNLGFAKNCGSIDNKIEKIFALINGLIKSLKARR